MASNRLAMASNQIEASFIVASSLESSLPLEASGTALSQMPQVALQKSCCAVNADRVSPQGLLALEVPLRGRSSLFKQARVITMFLLLDVSDNLMLFIFFYLQRNPKLHMILPDTITNSGHLLHVGLMLCTCNAVQFIGHLTFSLAVRKKKKNIQYPEVRKHSFQLQIPKRNNEVSFMFVRLICTRYVHVVAP